MLKKQTAWLLTMLSLVVVLSVYYVTAPKSTESTAFVEKNKTTTQNKADEQEEIAAKGEKTPNTAVVSVANEDMFTALRMQIDDERNNLRQQLEDVVAATNISAEERSSAVDKMEAISKAAEKEAILETLLRSKFGESFVHANGNDISVTVQAKQESKKVANDVILMVKKEIPTLQNVVVDFVK